jgi:hypothetical protein
MTEPDIEAYEGPVPGVKAKSEAGGYLQVGHGKVAPVRHNFAGIDEQRAVQTGEDLPPVLCVIDHGVRAGETVRAEPAQVV